jgi:hypothetical protein
LAGLCPFDGPGSTLSVDHQVRSAGGSVAGGFRFRLACSHPIRDCHQLWALAHVACMQLSALVFENAHDGTSLAPSDQVGQTRRGLRFPCANEERFEVVETAEQILRAFSVAISVTTRLSVTSATNSTA